MKKKKDTMISSEEFDRRFDAGEDMTPYLDLSKSFRFHKDVKRVNVDFPVWMILQLDEHANRLGVTRQSVIKVWLAERLKVEGASKP